MFLMGSVKVGVWKPGLLGSLLAAVGLAVMAYLGSDSSSPLALRVAMCLIMPLAIVSSAFTAGRAYERAPHRLSPRHGAFDEPPGA